tara:strand:+ start:53 stop:493 length:441 start_codon:yes stop_codon:yes gene_type:complete
MKKIFIVLLLLGCGPQYLDDPNAHTLVTSQYEDGPVEIIAMSRCKPMVDCTNKTKSECAIAHYSASDQFIQEGEAHITRDLYLSAKLEFMQALCRLEVAKILLEQAKLNNFQDYQVVIQFDLEEKIEEKIKLCDRRMNFLRWKKKV